MGIGLGLGIQFYKKAGARLSEFLTWGQSVPTRFWGDETPEYWGGIDPQAQIAYDSLIGAGFTVPQGLGGINAAFLTIKDIYGTSDITTAISFFGDPSLAYEAGAGTGTTAGQAIRTLPNIIDPTRATDAVQTTAASQPLLLTHTSGENYWFGSGVASNFVSTPNAAANQITGDIEIIAKVIITNQSTTQTIIAKNIDVTNFSYWFGVSSTNNLRLIFSQNGNNTITATSTVIQPFNVNTIGFVKITRVASSGLVRFFTSTDGISYTQLGADVSTTSGNIFNGNASVKVGAYDTTNLFPFFGKIYRATISNSIGGAPVVDFNPNQYNPSTSQTQWTSSTGEVWSLNVGTAATGYKGQLVTKATMQSDGIDDRMITSSYTSLSSWTNYFAYSGYTGNNAGRLIDDIAAFQRNDLVLNTSSIAAFNGGLTIASRIVNNKSFLVTQKTTSNSSLGYQNTNTPTVNLNDARAYTFSGISLFSAQNGAGFGNASLDTLLISKQADNSTQRTGVYNYVRSLNGAAF